MFPTGYALPICAGEDGFFGEKLSRIGAKKKIDFSIQVDHIAPSDLQEYWRIRKGRGEGSPQVRRFLNNWSMSRIILRALLRVVKTMFDLVVIIPIFWRCYMISRVSPNRVADLIPFVWAALIEQLAFHVGEWSSIFKISSK
jgi:hypothetical protein